MLGSSGVGTAVLAGPVAATGLEKEHFQNLLQVRLAELKDHLSHQPVQLAHQLAKVHARWTGFPRRARCCRLFLFSTCSLISWRTDRYWLCLRTSPERMHLLSALLPYVTIIKRTASMMAILGPLTILTFVLIRTHWHRRHSAA